jgi:thiol-disulfide isomerase/thioredoxin/copper chaperone CopZ
MEEEYRRRTFPIADMDCPTCALTIEKELKKLEGVKDARVNFLMKKVIVTYNPRKVGVPDIEKKLEDLGYGLAYKKYEGIFAKIARILKGKRAEESISFRKVENHDFEDLVIKSNKPVVVIFTSPSCPSCKALKARLREASGKFLNRIYIYEMDVTATKKWTDYNVIGFPTLLYFKDGRETARQIGFLEKEEIERKISEILQA